MERYINLNVNKKYIITLVKNKIKLRKNLTNKNSGFRVTAFKTLRF